MLCSRRVERKVTEMAKALGKNSKKQIALLEPSVDANYMPRMHVDLPLDEIEALNVGQEVVLTVKGCIKMLEAKDYGLEDGCVGIEVYEKKLRKTSNLQASGIKDLAEEADDY